jgi:hypothetical protein
MGNYENGWHNADSKGNLIVSYQFTAEGSGVPIPPVTGDPEPYNARIERLEARIQMMNADGDSTLLYLA